MSSPSKAKITIGIRSLDPPYVYDDDSEKTGVLIKLLQVMAHNLDLDIQFKRYSWNERLRLIENNQLDGTTYTSFSEDRLKIGAFPMKDGSIDARNRELSVLSTTDQLTGLYNRRYLEEKARELIHRCERFGESLTLLMLDIDHFKSVNDNFGHDVGDDVLVNVAHVLRENTRKVDVAGRWGGEEFMILFQSDAPGAAAFAEKLRHVVMEKHHEKAGKITASFGITQYISGDSMDSLSKRADQALYLAKEHGRNRVEEVFAEAID